MPKPLQFDPAKAEYSLRYTHNSRGKKDGSRYASSGPYWYAHVTTNGHFRTHYLGKELPEECIPYVPKEAYTYTKKKTGPEKQRVRGASDTLLEALDRGEQVVLDIKKIAEDCGAYFDKLDGYRYLIYRDPKE